MSGCFGSSQDLVYTVTYNPMCSMSRGRVSFLERRLQSKGTKRILALDGGGVRGALSLGVLEVLEGTLRERLRRDEQFRLRDYFDLICGTSTGAIIAAALAAGKSASQIHTLYRDLAKDVFKKGWKIHGLQPKYNPTTLLTKLKSIFVDEEGKSLTLGSPSLTTGLAILTQRLDQSYTWVAHNNPRGRFYTQRPGKDALPNKDYRLPELLRASAAAPYYFPPQVIRISPQHKGVFVDGGLTGFNNPSLAALMIAAIKGFGFEWPLGKEKLLVVSVGTGWRPLKHKIKAVLGMGIRHPFVYTPSLFALMESCDWLGQSIMQWMSNSPLAWRTHGEMRALSGDLFGDHEWFTYLRYNAVFERKWLKEEVPSWRTTVDPHNLAKMDAPSHVDNLYALGKLLAEQGKRRKINPKHFQGFDDLYAR